MSGLTSSAALWYASRATGVVSLLLLSAVVVFGVLVNRQGHLPGLPRFAVTGLHRNLALLGVVFVVVHIMTAVFDSYVSIRLVAAIIPFTSSYEPFWLGLGAVAVDLLVAVIVTSLLRARIAPRLWRAVHWLAYAIYPVVVVHSIGSSRDLQGGWLLMLTIGCVAGCVVAVGFRLVRARAQVPRARRVGVRLGAVVGRGAQR